MYILHAFPEILQVLSTVPCTGSAHMLIFRNFFLMLIIRHKTSNIAGSWLHVHFREFAAYNFDEHPLAKQGDTHPFFASVLLTP